MQPELITFQTFEDPAMAQNLAGILTETGIEAALEENTTVYNLAQVNQPKQYFVKIKSGDFEKARQVLNDYESRFTDDVEPGYYLFDFTEAELMEIIAKPDEWSAFDYVLAKKLLAWRGVTVDEAAEKQFGEDRIKELKKPERTENTWIMFGYIFAICGGVLGFFIGWQLWKGQKTLPNGEQIYTYSPGDRQSGRHIFYLSIAGLLMAIIYKVLYLTDHPIG
ncbi:MAG: hypothetical protein V4592_03805 [Bacteroidota bacterium]